MKRLFCIVLSVLLVVSLLFAAAGCTQEKKLSARSEEDQLEFLAEQGIDVPSGYENIAIDIIADVEENPDHDYAAGISNPMSHDLIMQVQKVVCEYYGYEYSPIGTLWYR